MQFRGGVKEAAKILSGLGLEERKKLLILIAQKDPQMAEVLKKNILEFEDLKMMTSQMVQDFLRQVKVDDLALALRLASKGLQEFFLSNVSKGIGREIKDILEGPPQKRSSVDEATEKVLDTALLMLEKGQIVLKEDGEQLV
jgi:flagellar motor switch protein FliG